MGFKYVLPCGYRGLDKGNGIEGAMVCTSLGSLLRPLFYFLCSFLKANPVQPADIGWPTGNGKKLRRSLAQLGQAACMGAA